MMKEFKTFIIKGNVLDLAVGIVIGAAFGKIVSSFVSDILTPIISLALGNVDFTNIFITLDGQHYATLEMAKKAGAATINIGLFANATIDFLIIGFAIFLVVKAANKFKAQAPAVSATTKECTECLSVIPLKARKCAHCASLQNTDTSSAF